jgi:hypothetical protein
LNWEPFGKLLWRHHHQAKAFMCIGLISGEWA